ncbi:MAG TPA: AIR synthase-related protein, partial [Candidatus Nanoarchaeia archaeon]|nr:AIR synthase-related protein [Candidatus Nanoarchaeia archaeon]
MAARIEIKSEIEDARARMRKRQLESMGVAGKVHDVQLVDVYTIDAPLQKVDLQRVGSMLADAVTERATVDVPQAPEHFDWAIEIGYHPGVTDNVATTAREGVEDLLKTKLEEQQGVYSSQVTFLRADLSQNDVRMIAESLANPLIQRTSIKRFDAFQREQGMGIVIPRVRLGLEPAVGTVDLLQATNEELALIGKKGIANVDGTRRGPLALDLTYMGAIQTYFRGKQRNPTDVELESIAQTWSEHCKHTIFADSLDDLTEGLFKTYIKGATEKIRRAKGDKDFCVSVFKDNSGAIAFDDKWLLTDKVETHNSPSALDPFGGAITGIVGVNRDTIGFGLGARPVINRYAFCFADPNNTDSLYKGEQRTQQMLSPRRIMEGVIRGVNAGGNCSGIPTHPGSLFFDERYKGKPLVFVGTVGIIPRESAGRLSHQKQAQAGDYIVMVGGRVGKDGIHGATFSSEAMDAGSPATAVQIGDPITQKKLSDALVNEARDLGLYTSLTDNGAGGLSCSVAEMDTIFTYATSNHHNIIA